MRIAVIGGGPAGLYFALLMKKQDPGHEVTVVERNPPGATFGWGVVFSEETLGSLRDADPQSHEAITDSFARWSCIDVVFRGQVIRSRGHVFSGLSRRRLLAILHARCEELGVELRFEQEIAEPAVFAGHDLVVGADGVNSMVRRAFDADFRPSLDVHRTKYVWFGTPRVFDAFTFAFRESEHGLFQVHAYPFDAEASTFIVECREDVWLRAGLDRASEEDSIRYCEKLFHEELRGQPLLSNRSLWVSFVTLRCETWHRGNVVLMGDAAHTAHFTIGSGTKLAMEDAVSLAEAFGRHGNDLTAAFTDYEMERQPAVERLQEAARESATYFENVPRYASFEPIQFAFNLLTRSGRITHLNLTQRDPALGNRVDGWFAGSGGNGAGLLVTPAPMLVRLPLAQATLGNRVVLALRGEDDAEGGVPGKALSARVARAAVSGVGLVLTEFVAASPEGRITQGTPGIYLDDQAAAWTEVVVGARAGGALGLRLGHAGPRASMRPRASGLDRPLPEAAGGWPTIAASAVRYAPWIPAPAALDRAGMPEVAADFARAAERAAGAGFDLLLLDFAHGYLPASFLSPLTNRRADPYGGDLMARARCPLEILDAVRGAWPAARPLAVSIAADDCAPGGADPREAVALARMLGEHGADVIDVHAGQTTIRSQPDYRRGFLVPYSDRIRNEAGLPTIVGGNLTTPDEINTILAAGRADLCVLDPRVLAAP